MTLRWQQALVVMLALFMTATAGYLFLSDPVLALGGDPFVPVAVAVIAIGEMILVPQVGRQLVPVSTACAMALILSPIDGSSGLTWPLCVLLVALAMVLGAGAMRVAGRTTDLAEQAGRLVGIGVAAALARTDLGNGSILDWAHEPTTSTLPAAIVLILIASVGVGVEVLLWTFGTTRLWRSTLSSLVRFDLVRSGAIGSVMTTAGALIAVTKPRIGTLAMLMFLWPIFVGLYGQRRAARVEAIGRQLVTALSRLTDETGHTTKGHAQRVAQLGQSMAEDLGLTHLEVMTLHDAALLHDVGQVTLNEVIPEGSTFVAAPAAQLQVIHQSVNLAEHAGVDAAVIEAIAASTTQFRQSRERGEAIPMISRIIKVANAYDDLTHGRRNARMAALERIHLGLGYEYDPRVVDALTRVTEMDARPHH